MQLKTYTMNDDELLHLILTTDITPEEIQYDFEQSLGW
jgi:hypothetical protein